MIETAVRQHSITELQLLGNQGNLFSPFLPSLFARVFLIFTKNQPLWFFMLGILAVKVINLCLTNWYRFD